MAAYVLIDIDVHDPAGYEEYKKAGAPTMIAYGGKPLARGPKTEVIEGKWQPKRLVLLEFKDMAQAKRWWNSPEYNEAKKLRHSSASANVVFFEGISPEPLRPNVISKAKGGIKLLRVPSMARDELKPKHQR